VTFGRFENRSAEAGGERGERWRRNRSSDYASVYGTVDRGIAIPETMEIRRKGRNGVSIALSLSLSLSLSFFLFEAHRLLGYLARQSAALARGLERDPRKKRRRRKGTTPRKIVRADRKKVSCFRGSLGGSWR